MLILSKRKISASIALAITRHHIATPNADVKTVKRKHHTSLCDTTASNDSGQTKGNTLPPKNDSTATLVIPVSSQPNPISTSHSLVSSKCISCLLKTAVEDVCAGTHYCRANILFCEGAQKSFISQKLADRWNVQSCK